MALADLTAFQNIVNNQQAVKGQNAERQQQQKQFETAQKLREHELELTHQHEQAVLSAQQAYQRTQQFNELAKNPAAVRAGGTLVGESGGLPMTNGPTNDLANNPAAAPTQQTYSVPSQVSGEQPFIINQPSRQEEANQQGQEAAVKNAPLFAQQQELENKKATAEQQSAFIRAYYDHEHDLTKAKLDRDSQERVAAANNAARLAEERMRSNTAFGVESMRIKGMYDPARVSQSVNDLYNGNTTMEDFNKSPLSKYEKENAVSGLGAAGAHALNKGQSDYLTTVANFKDIIPTFKEFIAAQPDTTSTAGSFIKGSLQTAPIVGDKEQIRRQSELQTQFGSLSKALQSGVSSGRIPIFEAQKLMGFMPDPSAPRDQNLAKYNDLVKFLGDHVNNTLSNIPMDQRATIVDNKIGTDLFKQYVDVNHLKQDSPVVSKDQAQDAIPTGRIKVKNKQTGALGHVSPATLAAFPQKYEEVK